MDGLERYTVLETALNEAGFMVDGVQKQGKMTIITVFRQPGSQQAWRSPFPGPPKAGEWDSRPGKAVKKGFV